ncbi:MAG: hypothetical protein GVY17_00070 [Cyanobacteria bacterium]|nr:hypothetical protein [Cyanobacteria bacterium GSL.Bin21]
MTKRSLFFYIESTNIIWKYVRAGQYAVTDVPADLVSLKALSLYEMGKCLLQITTLGSGGKEKGSRLSH